MTAGVFTTPSGGYPLISRRGYNASDSSRDTAAPTYWRSGGAVAGLVLAGFAAVVGGAVYPMAWATTAGGVRSLVLAIAAVLAALAGVTLIAAWQDHRNERRQRDLTVEIQALVGAVSHAVAEHRQQLDGLETLPRRMEVMLASHERHEAELLMTLREEARHIAERLDERLAALGERAGPAGNGDGQLQELAQRITADGDQMVPASGSWAFKLGREVERARWERVNGRKS